LDGFRLSAVVFCPRIASMVSKPNLAATNFSFLIIINSVLLILLGLFICSICHIGVLSIVPLLILISFRSNCIIRATARQRGLRILLQHANRTALMARFRLPYALVGINCPSDSIVKA